jgi:hypothetical protein
MPAQEIAERFLATARLLPEQLVTALRFSWFVFKFVHRVCPNLLPT